MATRVVTKINAFNGGLGGRVELTSGGWSRGEHVTLHDDDWDGMVTISAVISGTAVIGDVVEVRVDYDRTENGSDYIAGWYPAATSLPGLAYLTTLDLYSTAIGNEDKRHVPIETGAKGFRLYYRAPNGASRNVTITESVLTTHRGAIA